MIVRIGTIFKYSRGILIIIRREIDEEKENKKLSSFKIKPIL
jgi:hypothetical protein